MIGPSITQIVIEAISHALSLPVEQISLTDGIESLGIDSHHLTDIVFEIEERTRVELTDSQINQLIEARNIGDVVRILE